MMPDCGSGVRGAACAVLTFAGTDARPEDRDVSDWTKLITADDPIEAGFLRGLLKSAGIEVQLRSLELWTAAVEIYYSEGARPSIWVRRQDLDRARQVLKRRESGGEATPWQCPACAERLEGQFTTCWRCGHAREARG